VSQTIQKTHSLWQNVSGPEFVPLMSNLETDVCVVGAGIAGLTSAYELLKKGLRVVVIDKENFGQNETGFTTAHLSNALDDRYTQLHKWHGKARTRLAFESHTAAIDRIEEIIQDEGIECDFSRVDGYLFLAPGHSRKYLEEELSAAHQAGFVGVELLSHAPESFFESGPCLRFPRQGQFHALKYLRGLAQAVRALGGEIYGQTKAVEISGAPLTFVKTDLGFRISCRDIIVATNVPVNDLVTMHTKEAAYRSYALGLRVPRGSVPALFWDTAEAYHYVRLHSPEAQDYDVLIVGGEDHRVGQNEDPEKCFARLEEWAYFRLGISGEVLHRWSGQIIEPIDGLAYIGKNPGDKDNVYIVSGDSGHGMTHGTIAGLVLRDLITGEENPWADLYDPRRFHWKCLNTFARENFRGAMHLADWLGPAQKKSREDLAPGEGAILNDGLTKVAVYRDEAGELHEFSAACPHLKAAVQWNAAEQTWDCPFHGSRFSRLGDILNGPATADLEPKSISVRTPGGPEQHRTV
jgi:glycine/D-amino acid oxidase-like deaminating enzyme/nitrite reductase/ring-hydroxylating ferredoxin subunit